MYIEPVAAGAYRVSLGWSNCYVLTLETGGDVWLIDSGLHSDRTDLLAALSKLNIDPSRIRAIVLTHGHCDHAGNAAFFHSNYGSMVYAHEDEIVYLDMSRTPYGGVRPTVVTQPVRSLAFRIGERRFPVERCSKLEAVIENDLLNAPGGDLRVISSPGHTLGHIALFRESDRLLFSGDAVLHIVPHLLSARRRIGLSMAPRLFTDDRIAAISSARKLAALQPAVLASGHGPALLEGTAERLSDWIDGLT